MKKILLYSTALFLLSSCGEVQSEPSDIIRIDQMLADFDNFDNQQQMEIFNKYRSEFDAYFYVLGKDTIDIDTLINWSKSQTVNMFQPPVNQMFENITPLASQLGHIVDNAHRDSLGLPDLTFATVVWGKPQPLVRIDSIVLIALNHYLGHNFPGYSHLESYRRYEKNPDMIAYDVAGALAATQFPFNSFDNAPTLLNWMLYEGALVEARMQLVPDAQLHLALGYTPQQLEFAEEYYHNIWKEMVMQKLIFSTDHSVIAKMLGTAPNTPFINGRAPGRIGRYIGYKILKNYLKKNRAPLTELLSPSFYMNKNTLLLSLEK